MNNSLDLRCLNDFEACLTLYNGCRIQKDSVDPEKLQANLTDGALNQACDLKSALEMVALLETQMKEMNPNLDSISEYEFLCCP
jgi:structural maintenance of chromosome 4